MNMILKTGEVSSSSGEFKIFFFCGEFKFLT